MVKVFMKNWEVKCVKLVQCYVVKCQVLKVIVNDFNVEFEVKWDV